MNGESCMETHTLQYVKKKEMLTNENLFLCHWELKLGLCNNLEVWNEEEGHFKRKETYVFLWLIHVDVWQKPTQYF